jgi:uncharacterized protein related to proFAR isomerase
MIPPEDLTSDEAIELLRRALSNRRVRLVVEADLDPVPGWGDNAEDWRALVQRQLDDAVSHYNPTVTIEGGAR